MRTVKSAGARSGDRLAAVVHDRHVERRDLDRRSKSRRLLLGRLRLRPR